MMFDDNIYIFTLKNSIIMIIVQKGAKIFKTYCYLVCKCKYDMLSPLQWNIMNRKKEFNTHYIHIYTSKFLLFFIKMFMK